VCIQNMEFIQILAEEPMNSLGMRGLSMSGARWRSVAGAMLAVFFLTASQAVPVRADSSDWKDAVADIEQIRDEAVQDLLDLVGEFESYLTPEPSAAEAAEELVEIHTEMEQVASQAGDEIGSVMSEYPETPQVQNSGSSAIARVTLAEGYSINEATVRFDEYIGGLLPPESPPPTTTTTLPPVVTTTTVPVTTTTVPVTTTTVPVTTITAPSTASTTTSTTTTTTVPPSTTTTVAAAATNEDGSADPPASAGIDGTPVDQAHSSTEAEGIGEAFRQGSRPDNNPDPQLFEEPVLSSPGRFDQRGITASLTRVLEPILPATVADVVVSPLLMLELLWRAISSSGRGLVMPMSLLVFSLISLLWDRRSKKATTAVPS